MTDTRAASLALVFLYFAAFPLPPARGDNPPEGKNSIPAKKGMDCVYGLHRPTGANAVKEAAKVAIAENPENETRVDNGSARSAKGDAIEGTPLGSLDEKGVISTGRKWKPGRTIRIKFLGGHSLVRQKVERHAMEWTKHANIKFQFVGDPEPAEVRIDFQNGGSWSLLGTDALTAPAYQSTMNFGWLEPGSDEPTYSSVVLHEFGHMLGLIHEHMFPGPGGVKFNRDAAQEYYGNTQGWTPEMVQQQVLDVYRESDAATTPRIDKDSIMMYPIPEGLANIVVGWNTRLSPMDIEFIGRHYFPPPGLKPSLLSVGGDPTFGEVKGSQMAVYRFQAKEGGEYLVRVKDVPLEVQLLTEGSKLLTRGESADPQAGLTVGARLRPGEYTVRLRSKDSNAADSGQFEISVKKAD